jgi:hypothetical protein
LNYWDGLAKTEFAAKVTDLDQFLTASGMNME